MVIYLIEEANQGSVGAVELACEANHLVDEHGAGWARRSQVSIEGHAGRAAGLRCVNKQAKLVNAI